MHGLAAAGRPLRDSPAADWPGIHTCRCGNAGGRDWGRGRRPSAWWMPPSSRPLPFPEPDRIVRLRSPPADATPPSICSRSPAPTIWITPAACARCPSVAAMRPLQLTLTGAGPAARVEAVAVTSAPSPILGIRPEHGRLFSTDKTNVPGQPSTALIISHVRGGTGPAAIPPPSAERVNLDGKAGDHRGVLPADATFPAAEIWRPARTVGRGRLHRLLARRHRPSRTGRSPA